MLAWWFSVSKVPLVCFPNCTAPGSLYDHVFHAERDPEHCSGQHFQHAPCSFLCPSALSMEQQCSVLPQPLRNLEPLLKGCWALEKMVKNSHRYNCPQESGSLYFLGASNSFPPCGFQTRLVHSQNLCLYRVAGFQLVLPKHWSFCSFHPWEISENTEKLLKKDPGILKFLMKWSS